MDDRQDPNLLPGDTVSDNEGCTRHDKFSRSSDTAITTSVRKLLEFLN